jgi:REP element-mobilizing transposase RayT
MRGTPMGPKPRSIGAMIAGFKSGTIKRINELNKTPGEWVWQRNYYEHIIRNEQSLFRIRQYIRNNPIKWFNDPKNHLKNEIGEFDNNDNA